MGETSSRSRPADYDPITTVVLKFIRQNCEGLQLKDFQDILRRRDDNGLVFRKEWRPYIRSQNYNFNTRGFKLDQASVHQVVVFLSDQSLSFLGINKEAATLRPSLYCSNSKTTSAKMPPKKNPVFQSPKKKAPKTKGRKGSKSPPRPKAGHFHDWTDFKQHLEDSQKEKYDDTYCLEYGANKDTPFKWNVSSLSNMEIPAEGDKGITKTGRGALFEAITTDVNASTLRTKFYLREKDGKTGIHLLRPSSYEQFVRNIGEIEELQSVMYEGPSQSRRIARQQSIVKIKKGNQMNYSISEFYICPPAPTSEITGEVLEFCRDHFHPQGEDNDDEDVIADLPLKVAKKIIPGDVTIEGRYVEVEGERYPVTTAVFSFQLACKESEVPLLHQKRAQMMIASPMMK